MASQLKTKWARDTAREVEAKKMAAKVAIITSKQPRTKAGTTSRQAVAMSRNHSVRDKKDGEEVDTSGQTTAGVMREVRQLKRMAEMSRRASYSEWTQLMQRKHVGWDMNGTVEFGDTVRGKEFVLKTNKWKTYAHV